MIAALRAQAAQERRATGQGRTHVHEFVIGRAARGRPPPFEGGPARIPNGCCRRAGERPGPPFRASRRRQRCAQPLRRRACPSRPPRARRGSRGGSSPRSRATSRSTSPAQHEVDQRLLEGLHLVVLAGVDRIRDLVGPVLADQVLDASVRDHHLDGRGAAAAGARQQALADDAAQGAGENRTDLLLLRRREELDHAPERLGRVERVQRGEDEMARLRRLQRGVRGLGVAQLADQDDVRVLAQHTAKCLLEAHRVEPDLALVDDAAAVGVEDLDRVLDRDDVLAARPVDVVEHARERRRLPRARRRR